MRLLRTAPGPAPRQLTQKVALGVTACLAFTLLPGLTPATAAPEVAVHTGDNFTVTPVPAGYQVEVHLDQPLPVRSDAPTVVVDGETLGAAVESPDGRTLTTLTTDPAVMSARTFDTGWASQSVAPAATPATATAPTALTETDQPLLDADPGALGEVPFEEGEYDFGQLSVPLANLSGHRGEMQGKFYLPTTPGEKKTVLLLHGRHTWCYRLEPTPGSSTAWPCAEGYEPIPSFAGYDGLGRTLASRGYSVVSIGANAINARDNSYAPDRGAQARGQLVLDTLSMLRKANAGESVSFTDAHRENREVSLAEALTGEVSVQDLVGKWDLDEVGLMGHSRGGEGVAAATTLNATLEKPFGIRTILPLAPVDFSRMTVPNVAMNVLLPYCDGDVSNQQGQHLLDDSRYAFDDDVLRTATWVMGANHNFYNTVWTPGLFPVAVSDDWSNSTGRRTDPVCGTDPSVAETSIRLTAEDQYDQGTDYMAAWFRLTLGGEQEFLPLFDGSGTVPQALEGTDIRTVTTAPNSARATVTSFEKASSSWRTVGAGLTALTCASLHGRTVVPEAPACTTALASSQAPHWTPATVGTNVPASPMAQMNWTNTTGALRVTVPAAARNASGYERLSFKVAPGEAVTTSTNLTVQVLDAGGVSWSGTVADLNPQALVRMPTSTQNATTLGKIVLQQVNLPVATLRAAGLDVSDLRQVKFSGTEAGGSAFLSDLAFENSAVGTPEVSVEPALHLFTPQVDEGNSLDRFAVAVLRTGDTSGTAQGHVSVIGSDSGRVGITMEKVTFAPGETCTTVWSDLQGDTLASGTASSSFIATVTNTRGAVQGDNWASYQVVREDDGVTGNATELPAAGTPGDLCAEAAAARSTGTLSLGNGTVVPEGLFAVTGDGFRAGESVQVATADQTVTALADATGRISAELTAPSKTGRVTLTATGQAYGRTATVTGAVRHDAGVTVSSTLSAATSRFGTALTGRVSISGASTGTVGLTLDGTPLGTARVVAAGTNGTATFTLPRTLAVGTHRVVATYLGREGASDTDTSAAPSASASLQVTRRSTGLKVSAPKQVTKGRKATLRLRATGLVAGTPASGTVTLQVRKPGQARFTTLRTVRLGTDTKVTLGVGKKKGTLRVRAVWAGNTSYTGGSRTVRVRVR